MVAAVVAGNAAAKVQLNAGSGGDYQVQLMSWAEIPFRSVVRQRYDFSCGSAAVATLLSFHYGHLTPERPVFSAMWTAGDQPLIRKFGFSMLDLKRYLDGSGYPTEGFRLSIDQLRQLKRPGIVILNLRGYKHFVVLKGFQGNEVLVGDPVLGLMRYSASEFGARWNGILLAIVGGNLTNPALFNLAAEWRPWSAAPLGDGADRSPISALTNSMPPYYQIAPTILSGVRAAVLP